MRIGGQFRFLVSVVGLWCCGRAAVLLWPVAAPELPPRAVLAERLVDAAAAFVSAPAEAALPHQPLVRIALDAPVRAATPSAPQTGRPVEPTPIAYAVAEQSAPIAMPLPPPLPAEPAPFFPAIALPSPDRPSRLSGSLWLFERGGRGPTALAQGGQLGGAQAGARIAFRLTDPRTVEIDLAARMSRSLRSADAEAAVGIDVRPLPAIPLRFSIEHRIAIERGGRNATAAYAAGGWFARGPLATEIDGYAQAGIVGLHARDGFVDGALRVAKPIPLSHGARLLVGAGAWGAAQPGASRLDVGPRLALALPAGHATAQLAVEGRSRIAGNARPGSGIALTGGLDF